MSRLPPLAVGAVLLALNGRLGEEIVIMDKETGEQIVIAFVEQKGRQVRIGIEASRRFDIVRREVLVRQEPNESG